MLFDLNKADSDSESSDNEKEEKEEVEVNKEVNEKENHPTVGMKTILFDKSIKNTDEQSSSNQSVESIVISDDSGDERAKLNSSPIDKRPSVGRYGKTLSSEEKEFLTKRFKDSYSSYTGSLNSWAREIAKESGEVRRLSTFRKYVERELLPKKENSDSDFKNSSSEEEEEEDIKPKKRISYNTRSSSFNDKSNNTKKIMSQKITETYRSAALLDKIKGITPQQVERMNVDEVIKLIMKLDKDLFNAVEQSFREEAISGFAFLSLTQTHMDALKLKIGYQIKIQQIIMYIRENE
ncbi:hypothetical protein ABK040_006567 [Willaertia magna]